MVAKAQAPEETEATEVVVVGNKFSVTFERTVSDGAYGSTKASIWLQGESDPGASPEQVAIAAGAKLNIATATVFDHLGIPYHLDEEVGVLREDAQPVSEQRVQQALKATPAASTSDRPGERTERGITIKNADEGSSDPLPEWFFNHPKIKDGSVTKIYDRRLTRNAERNQAHFAEAARKGEGHGKDGQAQGFWPPKD